MDRKRQRFETEEEKYYLSWTNTPQSRHWITRTVIFHYSNGTNKCCIKGCDAPIEALTLEHENFDKVELNRKLGYAATSGGYPLASALLRSGFPDVNITVKCFKHNMMNQHPEHSKRTSENHPRKNRDHIPIDYEKMCSSCKEIKNQCMFGLSRHRRDGLHNYCSVCNNTQRRKNQQKVLIKAYKLYGYEGSIEGMSFEHSNNDGYIHRKYLAEKYGWKQSTTIGGAFAALLLREHEQGVPNYPGLIVVDLNQQMIGLRKHRKEKREQYSKNI